LPSLSLSPSMFMPIMAWPSAGVDMARGAVAAPFTVAMAMAPALATALALGLLLVLALALVLALVLALESDSGLVLVTELALESTTRACLNSLQILV
ncbi:hypothetical protein GGI13_007389, partial [Coemansia sp. RSA 455]